MSVRDGKELVMFRGSREVSALAPPQLCCARGEGGERSWGPSMQSSPTSQLC